MSGLVDSMSGAAARRQQRASQRAQSDATGRQLAAAASEAARQDQMTATAGRRQGRRALTFLGPEPQTLG